MFNKIIKILLSLFINLPNLPHPGPHPARPRELSSCFSFSCSFAECMTWVGWCLGNQIIKLLYEVDFHSRNWIIHWTDVMAYIDWQLDHICCCFYCCSYSGYYCSRSFSYLCRHHCSFDWYG